MSKPKTNPAPAKTATPLGLADRLLRQGWASVAVWMSVGLLLEGLLGYKIPAYLNDPQRRELFRLAHTHGTLLGILLVVAALVLARGATVPGIAATALRVGAVLMPVGFFIAGIWHTETDPGLAVWLVPPGALLVIYAAVAFTLAYFKKPTADD
jgi:hypothetical protein